MTLISILLAWLLFRQSVWRTTMQRFAWTGPQEGQRFLLFLALILCLAGLINYLFWHGAGLTGRVVFNFLILSYCWAIIAENASIKEIGNVLSENLPTFALLFWFVVLGPIAALFYTLSWRNGLIRQLCDWPAVRLLAFGYALAGHFPEAFAYWRQHLFDGAKSNALFLTECGIAALQGETKFSFHAKAMVKRAKIMLLLMLALFTLGAWWF